MFCDLTPCFKYDATWFWIYTILFCMVCIGILTGKSYQAVSEEFRNMRSSSKLKVLWWKLWPSWMAFNLSPSSVNWKKSVTADSEEGPVSNVLEGFFLLDKQGVWDEVLGFCILAGPVGMYWFIWVIGNSKLWHCELCVQHWLAQKCGPSCSCDLLVGRDILCRACFSFASRFTSLWTLPIQGNQDFCKTQQPGVALDYSQGTTENNNSQWIGGTDH